MNNQGVFELMAQRPYERSPEMISFPVSDKTEESSKFVQENGAKNIQSENDFSQLNQNKQRTTIAGSLSIERLPKGNRKLSNTIPWEISPKNLFHSGIVHSPLNRIKIFRNQLCCSVFKREYTKEDVAKHNNENDCWVILYDKVYNLTRLIPNKPEIRESILPYAGQDATNKLEIINQDPTWKKLGWVVEVGKLKKNPQTCKLKKENI